MDAHISFDQQGMALRLLDQRLLPERRRYYICKTVEDVIDALQKMVVRGAPAIGVTAAFGCVLAANALDSHSSSWRGLLDDMLDDLAAARPTAVNLAWAVSRMRPDLESAESLDALLSVWLAKAREIQAEDIRICEAIGKAGAELIQDGDTVLTHCNAGALATAGYGTALGVIRAAIAQGKNVRVIADETRPLLQGARLTAYELAEDNIPVTVACDNACALLMQKGLPQMVITGADRVAANGDTANKIGTFGVAILASHFNIPFYVACPLSTIDASLADGSLIPIEERAVNEVAIIGGARICPENVPVYNFAFDVTPASLIRAIITESGILRPPFGPAIAKALADTGK